MSLIEINRNPSPKELRNFATIALIASALLSLLLYLLKGLSIQWVVSIFAFGIVIFISKLISLRFTRIFYLALIFLTCPIGFVISFILLAAFYFLMLTPLSIIFRLMGRDPLRRKYDPSAKSYWIDHSPPESLERYFRQF